MSLPLELRPAVSARETAAMDTAELRAAFLVEDLFVPGMVRLVHWETDRTVVGSAVPLERPLLLEAPAGLVAEYVCQRRELGVINIGGPGTVTVDGVAHPLAAFDGLYVGRGSRAVSFASDSPAAPARFYLVSYLAHAAHPTTRITPAEANRLERGAPESANVRTISQLIHEDGVRSCQLVLGFTHMAPGSVWNTMPAHTHLRRSEVYLYCNLAPDAAVFHFMGEGDQTRHLVVRNEQAVLSPPWSIHSGCGTQRYSFIWAMGGENQRFADMDEVAVADLR